MEKRYIRETLVVKTSHVFPEATNNHNTLFGGQLMRDIDDLASIAAMRLCRSEVVTASTDSVDFLHPITPDDSVCLEAYVSYTGKSSMEVFVKVIAEHLLTGERKIASTAFLTFVALDENKKPLSVPQIIPETEEEKNLHNTAPARAEKRREHRQASKELAGLLTTKRPWE
ncbi:acyl-CoA thioesterase [Guptibacillus algicola]|uniref:acyl-CoA thioesterase n=1 Tax=Guptibacillus algicola TaxID=225844 RepID=UPI001CD2C605|nr:acyl-CoA thioesterase [Alkalihalobacillus algicola]MCA0989521.1 acyl-CoA thioesterase [Alkalihalobacillus algicola]